MPHNAEAFADMVVMTVKAAVAPLLERMAALDQANKDLQARVLELSSLRDRVTVVETKAAAPVAVPESPSLEPVLLRVTALEQTTKDLQSKPGPVVPPDLSDRVLALEKRADAVDLRIEMKSGELTPIASSVADMTKDIGTLRERIAVAEVRQGVPGPAGKDGMNGKDGADGLGWDDLLVQHDGERTFTIKMIRGERVKDVGSFTVPVDIYRGVYAEGKSYERGDGVTWGGSEWHCNEATTVKPGEGSKAWTLKVKRGRDGKDGRDAVSMPVVSVGKP